MVALPQLQERSKLSSEAAAAAACVLVTQVNRVNTAATSGTELIFFGSDFSARALTRSVLLLSLHALLSAPVLVYVTRVGGPSSRALTHLVGFGSLVGFGTLHVLA